ncbi:MAG TPA: type II secretion system protein [Candidatus Sulfotelmatobacter sp.]|nr:type II secretion system protein [Candidatus Sulfotelmatobacter sp.]
MKCCCNLARRRRQSGITLIECVVYLMVFVILASVGSVSFFVCWDGFRALIATTDDVGAALRAGERWRADVRSANGTIRIETTASGQVVQIPENGKEIIYSIDSKGLERQVGADGFSLVVLPKVKSSDMKCEMRGSVRAWRWELELPERRKGPHLPLLFTFEAVQTTQ